MVTTDPAILRMSDVMRATCMRARLPGGHGSGARWAVRSITIYKKLNTLSLSPHNHASGQLVESFRKRLIFLKKWSPARALVDIQNTFIYHSSISVLIPFRFSTPWYSYPPPCSAPAICNVIKRYRARPWLTILLLAGFNHSSVYTTIPHISLTRGRTRFRSVVIYLGL